MPKETSKQRTERLALHQSFIESDQTMSEFARERGLTPWKVKHAVRKSEAEQPSIAGIQEVSLPLGGGSYSVTLRNGRELCVPAHFSEKRVRQLIAILETC